jgi:hypothetical protein
MESTDAGTETDINLFHELYYHVVGTDQFLDILCWKDSEHAKWLSSAKITDDGQVRCEWHFIFHRLSYHLYYVSTIRVLRK